VEEFEITAVSGTGGELRLGFPALAGRTYVVETRAVLAAGEWVEVQGTRSTGDGARLEVFIPRAFTEPQRFYRVKRLP
jgi:hypothetical protein